MARIGEYRHRVTIERKVRAGTPAAYTSETWLQLGKKMWAKMEARSPREVAVGDQIVMRVTQLVTMRRRTDVTAADRIDYKGRKMAILGLREIDEGGWRWTELTCEEGAPS
jgi:SPP1 family predicted phage head-tail adaptor